MIQIQPAEYLPITRQLADPSDTTTYYVRAYIYKRTSGGAESLLATVDLVDKTGQRFTYNYQTPDDSDPYYLSIVTKVFTDSGYTSESPLYYRTEQTYLVAMRWGLQFGGGGGASVDYEKIGKMIREAISNIPKTKEIKLPKEFDGRPLWEAIKDVENRIKRIKIPEQEKLNVLPILRAIKEVQEQVEAIKIPEPEKVDLQPAMNGLTKLAEELKKLPAALNTLIEGEIGDFKTLLEKADKNSQRDIVLRMGRGERESEKPEKRKRFI